MRLRDTTLVSNIERIFITRLEEVAFAWEEHVQKNFESQGGEVGGWSPLSPHTVKWRGSSEPILKLSGELSGSWTTYVLREGSDLSVVLSFTFLQTRSLPNIGLSRAHLHHYGGIGNWRKKDDSATYVPDRPLFSEEKLLAIFIDKASQAFGEAAAYV